MTSSLSPNVVGKMAQQVRRHSGLQKQVLSLYREFIVNVRQRPEGPGRESLLQRVRHEFKVGAALSRVDVETIERRLVLGRKQLKLLRLPGTEAVTQFGPPAATSVVP